MSTTIENEVVSIRFDNEGFDKKVDESSKSLERMRNALQFSGASSDIKTVQQAINDLNVDNVARSVDTIASRFSTLGISADQIIRNITNRTMSLGETIAKTFTTKPVKTGFAEYETQINAVQTILANTKHEGTTLEQVNAALDELNVYADKTIYNFTEMTRNIGTFTAAGVGLDTSVKSIQGIANLAAMSGSSSEQASRGMYQLSQALAAGALKLQDWNSVVSAGMGGKIFQDELVKTAKAAGGFSAEIAKQVESGKTKFRESLKEEWITSDILTKTLAKFTDESTELGKTAMDAATKVKTISQLWSTVNENVQSGWTQSWEWIIGDFETARTLLTKIANKINSLIQPSIDSRNKALEEWATKRDPLKQKAKERTEVADELSKANQKVTKESESFAEAFAKADKVVQDTILGNYGNQPQRAGRLKAAGYSYREVQPKVNEIMALLNKSNAAGGKQSGSDMLAEEENEVLTGREMFLKGLQNIWNAIYQIYIRVRGAFREVFPKTTGEQLTEYSEKFMNFTAKLKPLRENLINLKKTFKGFFSALDLGFRFVKSFASGILSAFGFVPDFGGSILEATGKIGDFITELNESTKAEGTFEEFADSIREHLQPISDWISEFLNGADISGSLETAKNSIKDFFDMVDSGYQTFIDDKEKADEAVQNGTDPAAQVADIESPVATIATTMKAIDQDVTDITTSATPAATALDKIEELWAKIVGWFSTITNEDVDSVAKVLNAAAFILVAAGIKKVTKSFSKLIDRVGGVTQSIKGAFNSIKEINVSIAKIGDAVKKKVQAESILALAASVTLLVASVAILGSLDTHQVIQGATAVAAVCGILLGAVKGFVKIVKSVSSVDRSMKVKSNNENGLAGKLHKVFGKNNVKSEKTSNVAKGPGTAELDPNSVFGTMCLFLLALTSSMMLLSVAVGVLSFIPEEKLKSGLSALTTITMLLESFIMGVAQATANVTKSSSKSKSFNNKSSKSKSRKDIGRYASTNRSTSNAGGRSSSESNQSSVEKSLDGVAGAILGFAIGVIALIGAVVVLSLIPTTMFQRGYERIVMIAGLILLVISVIGKVTETIFKTVEKSEDSTSKLHKKLSGFGKNAKKAKDAADGVADGVKEKDKDKHREKDLKKTESTAKYITGLAGIMMAFAAAISLLVIPITILSFIPFDRLATGVIAVTALGVVMVLLTLALQKIANMHQENASLSSVSIAILAIAVALNLLVLPILLLGRMPWQQLLLGGGVLVVLMYGLYEFIDRLAKISSDEHMGDSLKGVAYAMMGLVLSISILIRTIGTLSDVENPGKVLVLFSVISAFMAAFMGLLIGLTAVAGKTGGDPLKAAGAMAIAAAAFGAVVAAIAFVIWKLSEIEPSALKRGMEVFETIANCIIVFTMVIGAIMLLWKGIEEVAKAKSGAKTAEAAMDALPEGLDKTGEAAEKVGKSSKKASKGLGKVMSTIGKVIVVISLAAIALAVLIDSLVLLNEVDLNFDKIKTNFIGLIDVLIAAAPRIAELAIVLVREFFRGLYSSLGVIYQEALAFVRQLCDMTLANQDLWELLKTAVCSVLDGLGAQLGPIASSAVSFVVSLLNAIGNALTQNDNELGKAIVNVVGAIVDVVGAILAIGWEAIFGEDFETKLNDWGIDWHTVMEDVKSLVETVVADIIKLIDNVSVALEGFFNGEIFHNWLYYTKTGLGIETSKDQEKYLQKQRSMILWTEGDLKMYNHLMEKAGATAENYHEKLTAEQAATIDELKDLYDKGLTNNFENEFIAYWGIHSPSKRMEDNGKHVVDGLAKGIKENEGTVTGEIDKLNEAMENSSADIPQDIKDRLSNAFSNFKGDVSNDKLHADVDLSVTPVTDMTDFTDSLNDGNFKEKLQEHLNVDGGSLDNLFDNTNNNSLTNDITEKLSQEDFTDYSYDDSELKERIDELKGGIDGLSTILSDQKIYLDTGAVAGGIAPKVDSLLAVAGARSARIKGAYGG